MLSTYQSPSQDLDPILCLLCRAGVEEECSVRGYDPAQKGGGGHLTRMKCTTISSTHKEHMLHTL